MESWSFPFIASAVPLSCSRLAPESSLYGSLYHYSNIWSKIDKTWGYQLSPDQGDGNLSGTWVPVVVQAQCFFFFFTQVQTPVTLLSGELWSILVVRQAHSADPRSWLRHVSSAPSVAYSTGCSQCLDPRRGLLICLRSLPSSCWACLNPSFEYRHASSPMVTRSFIQFSKATFASFTRGAQTLKAGPPPPPIYCFKCDEFKGSAWLKAVGWVLDINLQLERDIFLMVRIICWSRHTSSWAIFILEMAWKSNSEAMRDSLGYSQCIYGTNSGSCSAACNVRSQAVLFPVAYYHNHSGKKAN